MSRDLMRKDKKTRLKNQGGMLVVIAVLCVIFTVMNTAFILPDNIMNIVRQSSVNIIMALGVTFIMISGQIDMSIGGVACLTGMVSAIMLTKGVPIPLVIILGMLIGVVFGIVNGLLVTKGGLPSMIVTLATMNIANGIANLLTDGTAVYGLPEGFSFLGRGYIGFLPFQVVVMIILFIISAVVLSKTIFGRYAYTIGGSRVVARLAGINVFFYQMAYFVICSACASLAGMILTSRMMTGQPVLAANSMIDIMTAVVIGGAGLAGSKGSVFGSLLGAILLTVVSNGLTINGVNSFWQLIITAVILLAVIIARRENKK